MANIGIDMRMAGSKNGGIGRYIESIVPLLISKAAQHTFFCVYDRGLREEPLYNILCSLPNANLQECNIRHYSWREQWHFANFLNKQKLDLVFFPNFNVPLRLRAPFAVTIHDMVHHKISGAKKSRFLHFLAYKKIIEQAAKKSKKIFTVSEASKSDICSLLSVPTDKVAVIYEGAGIKTEVAENEIAEIKRKYFLNRPYFLFVGVLERKKNIVNLARGFDRFLQESGVDMDLVLAGRVDPHYPLIKHQALDIKHSNRLVFTDFVSEKDLPALYAGAFAFVSASMHEGFGLPGVEAMQFGLPLLVSNTPTFNEIYDNAAVYFDPAEPKDIAHKMSLLAKDVKFQQQLSDNSFARGQFFSWDKCAQETLDELLLCL